MNSANNTAFLLADIGGTHVRMATSNRRGESPGEPLGGPLGEPLQSIQSIKKYRCAEYSSIDEILQDYLQQHALASVQHACFAVAAPVSAADNVDEIAMTNIDWKFSVNALREKFAWQQLAIINDFEAVAHAVPRLQAEQLLQLGGGKTQATGNIAVLGPGTGLGVKHIVPIHAGFKVLSGEGGQVDFAPVDEADLSLWQFLHEQNVPVAMEDVLSGRGLVHIYQAIANANGAHAELTDAKIIIEHGIAGDCALCAESLQHFCRILGSFAGNLALNLNTTGGVYLCGGVLTALTELIQKSEFRRRFEAKGRFKSYIKGIPVFIITAAEPGLLGASVYLQENG